MEHIDDWAKVKEHKFENMIILCANCHGRVTSKEIPKFAIRNYKLNLAVTNRRYSLFEMRLLESYEQLFSKGKEAKNVNVLDEVLVYVSQGEKLLLQGIINDGLFSCKKIDHSKGHDLTLLVSNSIFGRNINMSAEEFGERKSLLDNRARYIVQITDKGCEFIDSYFEGNNIL